MSTPAIAELEQAGVAHVVHEYEVTESVGAGYGEAVARAIGADPATVLKTLVVSTDAGPVVAVIPVVGRLSTKALARLAGAKRATMAEPAEAERLTGYVVGGVSPFGQRRSLRLFLDESALAHPVVFVSAGRRGLQVEVAPGELLRLTGGTAGPLT
jgi:Cys-tRNA(Pro)/Cys-tRNA(Cys) deacylase